MLAPRSVSLVRVLMLAMVRLMAVLVLAINPLSALIGASEAAPIAPPQPVITSITTSDCTLGTDGSLHDCLSTTQLTLIGAHFCLLHSDSAELDSSCSLRLANYTFDSPSPWVLQDTTSPGLDIIVRFTPAFFRYDIPSLFFGNNSAQPKNAYPFSLHNSSTETQPTDVAPVAAPLGIKFFFCAPVVGVYGCGHDV